MKSQSIEWHHLETYENSPDLNTAQRLANTLSFGGRIFRAMVPSLAIIIAAAWLIAQSSLVLYLQVSVWLTGFVFLAMAMDSPSGRKATLLLISGLAMFSLAGFSTGDAYELLVVGVAVVAVWLGFSIFDRSL